MDSVNAAAEVLALALIGGMLLLVLVELNHWIKTGSSGVKPSRPNRIPANEMQLLGEDYRVHIREFFETHKSREAIVKEVCRGRK